MKIVVGIDREESVASILSPTVRAHHPVGASTIAKYGHVLDKYKQGH